MTLVKEAISILKEHNLKITKQRQALLEYLTNYQHRYVDITQVDKYMHTLFPGMSHNTIYRNIKDFDNLGIIETQEKPSGACVKYQCDFGNLHHHHFICEKCGKVEEINLCPLNDLLQTQLPGYQIDGHRFEVYGVCDKCRKNS